MTLSPTGEAAIGYAARGWAVFPLRPREKTPATAHGVLDATTDIETVRRYWQILPDANIGIATGQASGLLVLDVDGPEAAAALAKRYPPLPETRAQMTARGRHLLFAAPGGLAIHNSAGRLCPGVDVRGERGYIVAAPSVHPSGHVYAWTGPDTIAEAPNWLIEALTAAKPAQTQTLTPAAMRTPDMRAIAGVLRRLAQAREGERNNLTYWAAHRLRERGIAHADAQAAIVPIAQRLGLPESEARRTIASAYRGQV